MSALASRSAAIIIVASVGAAVVVLRRKNRSSKNDGSSTAQEALIGNTPMVRLEALSAMVGRSIYVKMECLNPGGTGKDRAALNMIRHAEQTGLLPQPSVSELQFKEELKPSYEQATVDSDSKELEDIILKAMQTSRTGGLVVEGTSGSTGISLATLCASRGHACIVVLPDDQATEKQTLLKILGATVHVVKTAAISNPNHYVNIAKRMARVAQAKFHINAAFINQFENPANFQVHYETTGPEIWQQCPRLDAFVMSSGTGGTIAGVAKYLATKSKHVKVVLVDPPGSALWHAIHHGVAYAPQQQERGLLRHRYDTIAEGVGLDRITQNFQLGMECIEDAIRVQDQEAVDLAHWLLHHEGLWVGSSSAMNIVGAVRVALELPPNSKVVTVICDGGGRHVTRFWNRNFIKEWGLEWPSDVEPSRAPDCLRNITCR